MFIIIIIILAGGLPKQYLGDPEFSPDTWGHHSMLPPEKAVLLRWLWCERPLGTPQDVQGNAGDHM